jgi:hypothetical protein
VTLDLQDLLDQQGHRVSVDKLANVVTRELLDTLVLLEDGALLVAQERLESQDIQV